MNITADHPLQKKWEAAIAANGLDLEGRVMELTEDEFMRGVIDCVGLAIMERNKGGGKKKVIRTLVPISFLDDAEALKAYAVRMSDLMRAHFPSVK